METGYSSTRYLPFGETGVLVEFGQAISLDLNRRVVALQEAILSCDIAHVEELVPTYRSLLVKYDPGKTTYEQLVFLIKEIESGLETAKEEQGKKVIVPVVYGGDYGPDLRNVAHHARLTEEEIIKLHSEKPYRVYMIGFVAGFPYLGEVPEEIAMPRLESPRLRVPAGSVGIAEKQTGIYPIEAPGGWRIIGRTPFKLFDPLKNPPARLKAGDTVKFEPVSEEKFRIHLQALSKDRWVNSRPAV
jgi:KipI family sensor histidine kinase inhibitor